MDNATVGALLKLISSIDPTLLASVVILFTVTPFGLVTLLMVFWWANERKRNENEHKRQSELRKYRDDMDKILDLYGADVRTIGQYYKDNVELVKGFEKMAKGLQDTVVLNTQVMTRMVDAVCSNQYCPNARINKGDSPMK